MKLFNTPIGKVEELKPLDGKTFKVYTCGPTVYDYQHVGNYATAIRYDLLVRSLRVLSGYDVNYVMNLTDVGHLTSDADSGEDKLAKKATATGKNAWDVAEYYIADYKKWLKNFNFTEQVELMRATDYIDEQVALIQKIEENGFTYTIDDGVYFDISKFKDYAKLARLDMDGIEDGARVEVNTQKRNASDFALWKFCPKDTERDMQWESPWGKGFPGWHIECSAMVMTAFGDQIDIHGGGTDLLRIHHTNEVAQSESASGKQLSQHWFHSGFINIEGDKLSKSAGNGILPREIGEHGFDHLAFRMFVLRSKYNKQSNFTWALVGESQQQLNSLYDFAALQFQASDAAKLVEVVAYKEKITEAVSDDLNTPKAISILLELKDQYADGINKAQLNEFVELIKWLDDLFGLNLGSVTDIPLKAKELIQARAEAKSNSDYNAADQLRSALKDMNIGIRDTNNGTIWSRENYS